MVLQLVLLIRLANEDLARDSKAAGWLDMVAKSTSTYLGKSKRLPSSGITAVWCAFKNCFIEGPSIYKMCTYVRVRRKSLRVLFNSSMIVDEQGKFFHSF